MQNLEQGRGYEAASLARSGQLSKLERFLPDSIEGDAVVQVLPLPSQGSLGLLSSDGRFKRLPIEEFQELSGRATTVLKLKEGVTLRRVVAGQEGDTLVVASSTGRVLRLSLDETQLPLMGRAAQGPLLMRLLPGEQLVGAACIPAKEAGGRMVPFAGWEMAVQFEGLVAEHQAVRRRCGIEAFPTWGC